MESDSRAATLPRWVRVMAGVAAALIVLLPASWWLLASAGYGLDAGASNDDGYGYENSAAEDLGWLRWGLLGIPFFLLSELHPLLWIARDGKSRKLARRLRNCMLLHLILLAPMLVWMLRAEARTDDELAVALGFGAFWMQIAWSLYYIIVIGTRNDKFRAA